MKFTSTALLGALASLSTVQGCLLSNDAQTLAKNFGLLISNYSNKLANQTLAANFKDHSESVNTLIDNGGTKPQALLGDTFDSRAAFESASASQPSVPFSVQNVWYTCDTVIFRWESAQSPEPVVGIIVAHTVLNPLLIGSPTL
jgi:hypothetical protein